MNFKTDLAASRIKRKSSFHDVMITRSVRESVNSRTRSDFRVFLELRL